MTAATTPWSSGRLGVWGRRPRLLFGQMYEDWDVETSVFPPGSHVLTIASAGTTSMALSARGLEVTAVDINPAQIDYVRQRLAGGAVRMGTADRLFEFLRHLSPVVGMSRKKLRAFLELDDPHRQLAFWRRHFDTARLRLGLRLFVNPATLQLVYQRTFLTVMPQHFDRILLARFERCISRHPNRTNAYAWRLLGGMEPPIAQPIAVKPDRIELVEADAADYLENVKPASFDGFSLSNILDGTETAYGDRLMAAIRRSARKRAVVVLRSFAEPRPDESLEWVLKDRSMLWGIVRVETVNG